MNAIIRSAVVGALYMLCSFFFQAEDGIRDPLVTGVQTCALPILRLIADITSMCNVAEGIRIGMGMSRRAFDSAHRYAAWQEAEKALLADIVPYASVEAIGSLHEFSPGQTTTRHYHAHGHEVICVPNGTLRTELANGVAHVTSKSGARYIGSSVVHRGCNPSASESLQVLSINVRQHGTSSRVDLPA